MNPVLKSLRSSIGTKIVMATSGILLTLFLVAHVLGNLEVFFGRDAINHYGELLRAIPWVLWVVRAGLLVLVVVHVDAAIRLTRLNRAARPAAYRKQKLHATTWQARTMLASGVVLVAFVIYHILHFTVRSVEPSYQSMTDAAGRHDIFGMVVDAFRRPIVVAIYVVSMLLLGMHLAHGVASAIHTLGATHPRYHAAWRRVAPTFAWLLVLGFVAVPVAVLAGFVRP